MKVVTWNIWKGKYLAEVIHTLKTLKADIISLQEVKAYEQDTTYNNIGEIIAQELGYHFTYCKSFTTDRHTPSFDQGNAILCKYPFVKTNCHFLSTLEDYQGNAATEPRTAVEVEIALPSGNLTILNTHLGYSEDLSDTPLQLQQVKRLLQIVPEKRALLMGDFNALPTSTVIKKIETTLINTDKELTAPTRIDEIDGEKNGAHIDYIFTTEDISFSDFTIHPTQASDHTPLTVTVTL